MGQGHQTDSRRFLILLPLAKRIHNTRPDLNDRVCTAAMVVMDIAYGALLVDERVGTGVEQQRLDLQPHRQGKSCLDLQS